MVALGMSRHRWKCNIKMALQKLEECGRDLPGSVYTELKIRVSEIACQNLTGAASAISQQGLCSVNSVNVG
jgi:hypothetical protein